MNNINEFQTCPFRGTEVIFIEFSCLASILFLYKIVNFFKILRSVTFKTTKIVLCMAMAVKNQV